MMFSPILDKKKSDIVHTISDDSDTGLYLTEIIWYFIDVNMRF